MSLIRKATQSGRSKDTSWIHSTPSIADLQNIGELNIVFTSPEDGGTVRAAEWLQGSTGPRALAHGTATLAR